MFGRTIHIPQLGPLHRGWGKWYGALRVRQLREPLELWIETPRKELLDPFVRQAQFFADQFDRLQASFADELFETYDFYKQSDLDTPGGYSAADFANHPIVSSPADVWTVLSPYRLRLGPEIGKYAGNSYLLIDVDWPNPHFFQVFMRASNSGFEYVHTEFVG